MNILIVDNDKIYGAFIKSFYKNNKDNFYIVNSPLDVLELIKIGKYDLVITEMIMDKMNGIDLFNQIKKTDKNIKVIIHSNCINSNFEKLSKINGVYGYYIKPSFISIKKDIEDIKKRLAI